MESSTKIWLVTLNEGHSMIETAFSGIWTETLMATATHTHGRGEHYALFQCDEEPDLLAMILGNCYVDTSLTALSRITDFVTHKELFHLEMDANELPLDPSKIAISFSELEPADSGSLPGKGNWGVSTSWRRAKHNSNDPSRPVKKTWIHIASSEDADRLSQVGNIKNFSKIMESHVASQTAERPTQPSALEMIDHDSFLWSYQVFARNDSLSGLISIMIKEILSATSATKSMLASPNAGSHLSYYSREGESVDRLCARLGAV